MRSLFSKTGFLLLISLLLCMSCSKEGDMETPEIAKPVTLDDLLNYQIVYEFVPKPQHFSTLGNRPRLRCHYFTRNLTGTESKLNSLAAYSDFFDNGDLKQFISYNSETGITLLKTTYMDYEFTRDNNGDIILKEVHHAPEFDDSFTLENLQLVKLTGGLEYNKYTYKGIAGVSGYYSFSNQSLLWRFKENSIPKGSELIWSYLKHTSTLWNGRDGGTAKLNNLFIILPKGNGWKGKYKDKDLLLVNLYDPGSGKIVGDIAVCELHQ